jgi:rubrerythrin
METKQLQELLIQSLEHERGGKLVYETALECVENEDLREEFEKYLEETENHIRILEDAFEEIDLDVDTETPGRMIIRDLGAALVEAMTQAKAAGDPAAAELVACECVVLAETKDHLNWELLKECASKATGAEGRALKQAIEEVGDQETEHLYHSRGWCRELWIQSLGMKAVLPPPEERRDVKTAIGAARAEQSREKMT